MPQSSSPGERALDAALSIGRDLAHAVRSAFILMVQRSNFPNSDASEVRAAFQNAAAQALGKK